MELHNTFFSKRQEGRFLGVRTFSGNNFIGSFFGNPYPWIHHETRTYDRSYPHYEFVKIMFLP